MDSLPPFIIGAIVILVPLFYVIGQYNGFIALRNHTSEAWSNIDTELKRRYDLIPNLVATVKGYAAHEREVLERVTQLRTSCVANNGSPERQAAEENRLVDALRQLFAIVEGYPELKADTGYLKLQTELANTEDRIQAARRFYNGNVRDYRNKYESFPTNLIASLFNMPQLNFLEIDAAVREVPKVS